jgi:hypothetical protein
MRTCREAMTAPPAWASIAVGTDHNTSARSLNVTSRHIVLSSNNFSLPADSVLGFSRRNCRAEHIQNNLYGAPIAAFARSFLESRACEQWCSRACGVVNPLPILVSSAGSGLCAIPVTRGPASRRGTTLTCPGGPADSGIPHDAAVSRCRARPPIRMLEAIEVMSRPRLPVSTRPRNAPPPARTSCQLAEATKTATTNTA